MRLNFNKRYITLAPVATVVGLAFRLYDPDGPARGFGQERLRHHRGPDSAGDARASRSGRRHLPLTVPFQNGPIAGKDVFVPLDCHHRRPGARGAGLAHAGRVPVGRAAASRCPPTPWAARKAATLGHRRLRPDPQAVRHTPSPTSKASRRPWRGSRATPTPMNAARAVTTAAIDAGEKPAVPSAILKYHCTEIGREICNDAMDIHGGKGDHDGAQELPRRRLQLRPRGDHRRRRQHPDAQPDHLRPGRDPLPSVRAARAECRGAGRGQGDEACTSSTRR